MSSLSVIRIIFRWDGVFPLLKYVFETPLNSQIIYSFLTRSSSVPITIKKSLLLPYVHIWELKGNSPASPRKLTSRKQLQNGAHRTSTLRRWFCSALHVFCRESETSEVAGWRLSDVNIKTCIRIEVLWISCPISCTIFGIWDVYFNIFLCLTRVVIDTPWYWQVNLKQEFLYILFIFANLQVTTNCWTSLLFK